MTMLGEITVTTPPKRDVYQRARLFDSASFTHHAKANLNLLQAILDRYTDPGAIVLDPMGGAGSIYIGLLTGRAVIAGDIEAQWARLLQKNLECLSTRSLFAFSTMAMAACWDAAKLPLAAGQADICVTSPPYFDTFSDWDSTSKNLVDEERRNEHGISYGLHAHQIANIHIYEDYLRAMLAVYQEVCRVLRPGGARLILIVKDVIRGGRRVPVVADNLSVAWAAGFRFVERFDLPTRGTHFRNIQRVKGQAGPESESVLVLEKAGGHPAKRRLALLELPKPEDGPGWTIARKAFDHASNRGFQVWARSAGEKEFCHLVEMHEPSGFSSGDRPALNARRRKERAFEMVYQLQAKADLVAGDEIWFYGSDQRFGRYVCRRLETLGCSVTNVLKGLNNGQRLRWLTENGGNPCNKTQSLS